MKYKVKILSAVLAVVAVLALASCTTPAPEPTETKERTEKSFYFVVVDAEGEEDTFEYKSKKKTVGEALKDEGMIKGDEGEFGLYVKEVNGIVADYDKDGTYWAFYAGGEKAPKGVDQTEIVDGETYAFQIEK